MKNKKTKLLIGLLSMSVICMAGKSVNANRINSNDPVKKAQYDKAYYQKNRGLILPKQKEYLANKKAENELKLKTFDPNTSKAYNLFKEDSEMKGKKLVHFASCMYDQISKQTSLTKLGREQKRNMKLLYLWFDENWHIVQPYLYQQNFIKGE